VRPSVFTFPGGLELHSYGLAVALGFAVGIAVAARQARRLGLDGGAILDLAFWILVAGVLGSRLVFVILNIGQYGQLCLEGSGGVRAPLQVLSDCAAPLRLWQGGLVFYGGALAATGAMVLFAHRRRWPFAKVADVFAPGVAIGHVLGRLGCFFAGCCFGKPAPLGASFPPGSVAFDELVRTGAVSATAAATPTLHVTQLYEAAGELAIFFLLVAVRPRLRFHGATALLYVAAYAALRFVVELFRGDVSRGFVGPLSTAQVAGLFLAAASAGGYLALARRSRAA
jgi:phosphatidylglycerol:prolipoprotein diacylglycerol transferase